MTSSLQQAPLKPSRYELLRTIAVWSPPAAYGYASKKLSVRQRHVATDLLMLGLIASSRRMVVSTHAHVRSSWEETFVVTDKGRQQLGKRRVG